MRTDTCRCLILGISVLLIAVASRGIAAEGAPAPTGEEMMDLLGFSKKEKRRIREGEVVVRSLRELAKNQIAAVVAYKVDLPLSDVMQRFAEGKTLATSNRTLAWAKPRLPIVSAEWEEAVFRDSEGNDVEEILKAEPGIDLNLSTKEIATLRAKLGDVGKDERVQAVSDAYRALLQDRLRAYLGGGLDGVTPYDRGDGKTSSPADEIRLEWNANRDFLSKHFPDFVRAVDSYPNDQPEGIVNEVFWVKENFESKFGSRVAFQLEHDAWQATDDFVILSVRQFFVGHTYIAQQGIGLALPFEGGTLIFTTMAVSSDLIARYVPMIAIPIGKKIMRSEMKAYYEKLLGEVGP